MLCSKLMCMLFNAMVFSLGEGYCQDDYWLHALSLDIYSTHHIIRLHTQGHCPQIIVISQFIM